MKIAIIGTGAIGQVKGRLLTRAGYEVSYGSRHPNSPKVGLPETANVGTIEDTVNADTILLAMPWDELQNVADALKNPIGKIIIDATNPYSKQHGRFGLRQIPDGRTALQHTAMIFTASPVLKTFNTLTVEFQGMTAHREIDRVAMPLVGDDEKAKDIVKKLIRDMGFNPYDVGDSRTSRFIEPPRGPYSLYGEEWRLSNIEESLQHLRKGQKHLQVKS